MPDGDDAMEGQEECTQVPSAPVLFISEFSVADKERSAAKRNNNVIVMAYNVAGQKKKAFHMRARYGNKATACRRQGMPKLSLAIVLWKYEGSVRDAACNRLPTAQRTARRAR